MKPPYYIELRYPLWILYRTRDDRIVGSYESRAEALAALARHKT